MSTDESWDNPDDLYSARQSLNSLLTLEGKPSRVIEALAQVVGQIESLGVVAVRLREVAEEAKGVER